MEYTKGLALVASIKPKIGDVRDPQFLGGRHFSGNVVQKVDRATAEACEADGRFIVNWIEGAEAAPAEEPTSADEPEPAPAAEEEEDGDEEMTLDEVLEEFDALTVAKSEDYLDNFDDPELLKFLSEKAAKKGSRANAATRLREVQE